MKTHRERRETKEIKNINYNCFWVTHVLIILIHIVIIKVLYCIFINPYIHFAQKNISFFLINSNHVKIDE